LTCVRIIQTLIQNQTLIFLSLPFWTSNKITLATCHGKRKKNSVCSVILRYQECSNKSLQVFDSSIILCWFGENPKRDLNRFRNHPYFRTRRNLNWNSCVTHQSTTLGIKEDHFSWQQRIDLAKYQLQMSKLDRNSIQVLAESEISENPTTQCTILLTLLLPHSNKYQSKFRWGQQILSSDLI